MRELTGILLCGGKSLRMGTDKALLELFDSPMALYPLRILQTSCTELLISANDQRLNFLGHQVVPDEIQNIGPIAGLYACLKKSSNSDNMVIACDMPFVNGILLQKMIRIPNGFDAVVPVVNNRPEPLYALYRKSILPKILANINCKNYSLQELLRKANVYYMEVLQKETFELFNVNTSHELSVIINEYQITYGQLEGKNLP